jgi:putative nucleotidyltransferase with HDIG domain
MAALSTGLFWFGILALEKPFGITTHISLLELADTNKPVLKRLVMEAPGTYTHSMAVGHLAETAAEAVGADSLFARVAAYYHDVGKIRRPHFFVENQQVENVHDRMNPTLSALVIQNHIKDGIEVAKEFKLPPMLLEVIEQHHGTSLVGFFYTQATCETESPSPVLEQQFRYSGPKPQTREAGIVMLADAVEAASRSLVKPTPAKIEALINKVISEKLSDGQLDECELTFADINKIAGAFVRTLLGTLHARIEYPEIVPPDARKALTNGNSDTKLAGTEDQQTQADSSREETTASGGTTGNS